VRCSSGTGRFILPALALRTATSGKRLEAITDKISSDKTIYPPLYPDKPGMSKDEKRQCWTFVHRNSLVFIEY